MLVVMMCVYWRAMSFRLVYACGGSPFLEGSPWRIICSEGMIIKQRMMMTIGSEGSEAMQWTGAMDGTYRKMKRGNEVNGMCMRKNRT